VVYLSFDGLNTVRCGVAREICFMDNEPEAKILSAGPESGAEASAPPASEKGKAGRGPGLSCLKAFTLFFALLFVRKAGRLGGNIYI